MILIDSSWRVTFVSFGYLGIYITCKNIKRIALVIKYLFMFMYEKLNKSLNCIRNIKWISVL